LRVAAIFFSTALLRAAIGDAAQQGFILDRGVRVVAEVRRDESP
jgi:hypothetical protein